MRKTSLLLASLILTFVVNTSCNREKPPTTPVDEEFPTILMSDPDIVGLGSYITLNNTDSLVIDIRFEDDLDLKNFSVHIDYTPALNYLRTDNFPWKETFFGNLDGTVGGFHEVVHLPFDPSAGPYTFTVSVTDEAGNTTNAVTYIHVLNLQDTQKPVVVISDPGPTTVDSFMIGNNIIIRANITDNDVVEDVYVRVRDRITKQMMPQGEIHVDTLFVNNYALDTFLYVPAGTLPGDYYVEVYANDYIQNVGMDTVPIFIKP